VKIAFVLFLWSILGASILLANSPDADDDKRLIAKAADILKGTNVILEKETGGFDSHMPTEQGWAVSTIMQKAKNPADTFAVIAKTGSYPALLAIYVLDRRKFDNIVHEFRGADKVVMYTADSFEDMTPEDFVRDFLPGGGKYSFGRLLFKQIPSLVETVRGEPPAWEQARQ
jgi:hypothetical protein